MSTKGKGSVGYCKGLQKIIEFRQKMSEYQKKKQRAKGIIPCDCGETSTCDASHCRCFLRGHLCYAECHTNNPNCRLVRENSLINNKNREKDGGL